MSPFLKQQIEALSHLFFPEPEEQDPAEAVHLSFTDKCLGLLGIALVMLLLHLFSP